LHAHSGSQFDPEIVAVFEQIVDEKGDLRPLDPAIEATLDSDIHVPLAAAEEWRVRLAMLPVLEPLAITVRTEPEPCPVAPAGEECAVMASGEGCEIVLTVDDDIAGEDATRATPPAETAGPVSAPDVDAKPDGNRQVA
jgi:hypothetical protein